MDYPNGRKRLEAFIEQITQAIEDLDEPMPSNRMIDLIESRAILTEALRGLAERERSEQDN